MISPASVTIAPRGFATSATGVTLLLAALAASVPWGGSAAGETWGGTVVSGAQCFSRMGPRGRLREAAVQYSRGAAEGVTQPGVQRLHRTRGPEPLTASATQRSGERENVTSAPGPKESVTLRRVSAPGRRLSSPGQVFSGAIWPGIQLGARVRMRSASAGAARIRAYLPGSAGGLCRGLRAMPAVSTGTGGASGSWLRGRNHRAVAMYTATVTRTPAMMSTT
jgi:hypothetical protein